MSDESWLTKIVAWFGRGVDWLVVRINNANITNLRQIVTLGLVVGSGAVYLAMSARYAMVPTVRAWSPSYEWLAFLSIMSGLDIAQFNSKRRTDANYVAAKQSGSQTTTTTSPPGSTTTTTEQKGPDA